jgi:hypothetical protein
MLLSIQSMAVGTMAGYEQSFFSRGSAFLSLGPGFSYSQGYGTETGERHDYVSGFRWAAMAKVGLRFLVLK